MKIYINNYRSHWLSPYTILEKVFFWREIDYDEPIIERWADRLNPFSVGLQKILDIIHPKINYVKIDRWDTWSLDYTLAEIALPMLKQLQATKHGSPYVELEDVPEELRGTSTPEYDQQLTFDFYDEARQEKDVDYELTHKRWDWVMDEMIFAFEHKVDDSWEDAFREGEIDWKTVPCAWDENGKPTMYQMQDGPNNTYKCDYDGMQKVHDRMANGFRLFGKYYQGLWD
jgi:hypothetical protein